MLTWKAQRDQAERSNQDKALLRSLKIKGQKTHKDWENLIKKYEKQIRDYV